MKKAVVALSIMLLLTSTAGIALASGDKPTEERKKNLPPNPWLKKVQDNNPPFINLIGPFEPKKPLDPSWVYNPNPSKK